MSSLGEIEVELLKRHPHGLSIGVAIDGSQMSDRAASMAVNLTNTKRGDKLTALHISDHTKTFLPRHLQPTHLKNYYEDLAAKSRVKSAWLCREKDEGQSTCQALTKLADKSSIDLLVVGSFGRKGEKLDMLGSVSDHTLRESHASICIVRSTGNKIDKQAKYLFSTDGSRASSLAFVALINMLRRPTDIVNVVMVSATDGTLEQKFVEQYREYLQQKQVLGQVYVKCIDRTKQTVPEGILEAVRETESDILVLGISGYGKKKLGSVSEEISIRANCTTLVIKDGKEVLSNRYSTGAKSLASELLPSAPKRDYVTDVKLTKISH